MDLDQFLDLYFRSNMLLIEVFFGLVLAGIIYLTFRVFTRPDELPAKINLQGLEDGIKKILESHSGRLAPAGDAAAAASGANDATVHQMSEQIETLKFQLMQKSEEVEQLKAVASGTQRAEVEVKTVAAPPPAAAAASGDSAAFEAKIKDLEARLSEYAIIEDDIADLSFYKEETVRLQAEVDQLKAQLAQYEAGGVPAAVAPPTPSSLPEPKTEMAAAPVAPAAAPTQAFQPDPGAASQSWPQETKTAEPVAPPEPASAAQSSTETSADASAVDDDIMAEFERAVAEQKANAALQNTARSLPVEQPNPEVIESQAEVAPEPTATESTQPDMDAIAALASGPSENSATPNAEKVDEGINLDKMIDEVSSLPEQDTSETTNALEQGMDTEKLLQEATGMEKGDSGSGTDFNEVIKKEGA